MKSYSVTLWPGSTRRKFCRSVIGPDGGQILLRFEAGDKPIRVPESIAKQLARDISSNALSVVREESRSVDLGNGNSEDITICVVDDHANEEIAGHAVENPSSREGGPPKQKSIDWINRGRRNEPSRETSPQLAKLLGLREPRAPLAERVRRMNRRWGQ